MKRIVWTEPARADVRRLDKPTAMRVLAALHRFAELGDGDVRALTGREELRLRVGDYRLFFQYLLTHSRFGACSIAVMLIADLPSAEKETTQGFANLPMGRSSAAPLR